MLDTLMLPLSSDIQARFLRTRPTSTYCTPTKLSDKLYVFLGIENGTEMNRCDVTRGIQKYIRLNNLQDKQNKFIINQDTKLSILFGLNDGDVITYVNLQKYIGPHIFYPVY
jgi:chromatin remodeling complex protein RSC6